jgi:hypothetical protein
MADRISHAEALGRWTPTTPAGHMATSEGIADGVAFLVSDYRNYLHSARSWPTAALPPNRAPA